MQELKEKFLELLDKDKEFRYAVAGYLGITEILRRLDHLEETQRKILEEIKALRENQEKLWENQNRMLENQNKLWENQSKMWEEIKNLRENQEKLWEEIRAIREYQRKIWEEIKAIREDQRRMWEEIRVLREDQNKMWEEIKKLWEEVREIRLEMRIMRAEQERMMVTIEKLSKEHEQIRITLERLTLSVEEEARDVIRYRLKNELGIEISLDRIFIDDKEVNIYGVSDEVCVIGEATVRLGTGLVEELERLIDKIRKEKPELLRPKLIKVIYADYSVPKAIELASNYNIWVLNWKGDIISRKIVQ
jgi:DNA repair exonuclease SbcCD ATPase subunit